MFFLTLTAKSFETERTPKQRLKALGISALSGLTFPFFVLYTSGMMLRTSDVNVKKKYESRLNVLKLFELAFEALPQALLSWYAISFVGLGNGNEFQFVATFVSLFTSLLSLVVGAVKWCKFTGHSEVLPFVFNVVIHGVSALGVVLIYWSAFYYLRGFALIMPWVTLVSSFLVIRRYTEVDVLTGVGESFLSILTYSASFTHDHKASLTILLNTILIQGLIVGSFFVEPFFHEHNTVRRILDTSTLNDLHYSNVTDVRLNITLKQLVDEIQTYNRNTLNKLTDYLALCGNICAGSPKACQNFYAIQHCDEDELFQWSSICVLYLIEIIMLVLIKINTFTSPENRFIKSIMFKDQLKKKLRNLLDGSEEENEDDLVPWYIQLDMEAQQWLDNPSASLPDKEQLVQLLRVEDRKMDTKQAKLFKILGTTQKELKNRLYWLEGKSECFKGVFSILENNLKKRLHDVCKIFECRDDVLSLLQETDDRQGSLRPVLLEDAIKLQLASTCFTLCYIFSCGCISTTCNGQEIAGASEMVIGPLITDSAIAMPETQETRSRAAAVVKQISETRSETLNTTTKHTGSFKAEDDAQGLQKENSMKVHHFIG